MKIINVVFLIMAFALSSCGGSSGSGNNAGTGAIIPSKISWTPPTKNTDGSNLNDLSKYRIYYGSDKNALAPVSTLDFDAKNSSGNLVNSLTITELTSEETEILENLMKNNKKHYFALTAINESGLESEYSNIVEFTP